eukprot:CAMPEP_0172303208 /NCGR_PEP_ID=MMETSP1058-20130122/4778_1 /TAXON_ID=83371 /ORGANISM="Detonula confervacea, Strain CCMP 353" /LENGTH=452 /DNA_ID=CAMNT_0013013949 /DNA_START=90 /DNA_END=1448 /DNA_ORIENTATION=-
MKIFPSSCPVKPRCHRVAAFAVALSVISRSADAFTTRSTQVEISSSLGKASAVSRSSSGRYRSGRYPVFLETSAGGRNDDDEDHHEIQQSSAEFNPIAEFTRPLITAATCAVLATSLLFSNPLLPTPDAQAAANTAASASSQTATSIDIDLRSLPALTRKAIVNRDKLTNYLIESFKSFKPILDLLSESDTVTVSPPKDVKGAINRALTKGDAQFVVNGEAVDVRVESVPGVIIVRVINPNIPRLPFLKDCTAALKFVDEIVDVAPAEMEKAAEEVQAIEKFLMWGAPQKAPIQYKGSTLDYFLSSKFVVNGDTVSLGALGDLTNSEVALLGVSTGVAVAYSASYGYYVSLREEADQEAEERKAKMAAKKKAKAAADAKAKAEAASAAEKETAAQSAEVESASSKASEGDTEAKEEESVPTEASDEEAPATEETPKVRRRDAIKNIFRRGKE